MRTYYHEMGADGRIVEQSGYSPGSDYPGRSPNADLIAEKIAAARQGVTFGAVSPPRQAPTMEGVAQRLTVALGRIEQVVNCVGDVAGRLIGPEAPQQQGLRGNPDTETAGGGQIRGMFFLAERLHARITLLENMLARIREAI